MKKCCISCPFAATEESEIAQGYGCLPSPGQILEMHKERGEAWMCHSDNTRICRGLINNIPDFKPEGLKITTEANWEDIKPKESAYRNVKYGFDTESK